MPYNVGDKLSQNLGHTVFEVGGELAAGDVEMSFYIESIVLEGAQCLGQLCVEGVGRLASERAEILIDVSKSHHCCAEFSGGAARQLECFE